MRCERGQATVDYIALIAIVAVLIVAATAVARAGGPSIVNGVVGGLQKALCVVSGRACPSLQQQPCVNSSERRAVHVAVSVVLIRVDRDRVVVRENMSDGTVRLTLARRSSLGLEAGVGGRLQVKLKGRTFGPAREARIGAQGVFGTGEVFVAASASEADEIVRRLLRLRVPGIDGLPGPREIFGEGGIRGLGRLGLGSGFAGASLDGTAEGILAVRRDQRSGDVTLSLNATGSAWGLLNGLLVGQSRSTDRSAGLGLKLDRHGHPTGLTLRASGILAAGESLMPALPGRQGFAPTAGWGDKSSGRRWEIEARLDLADPGVAAAWSRFRRDRNDPATIRGLVAMLRDRAHLDVRTYAVSSRSVGAGAGVALAVKIGGEGELSFTRARLVSAQSRPPGGLWEQRIDCTLA